MNEEVIYSIVAKIRNYSKVKSVTIEIGQLASYNQEALAEELKKYVRCDLKFITRPSEIDCFCKYLGPPINVAKTKDKITYECPKCRRKGQKIVDGNKVNLKKIELA
jgi:Zn finger protein HypA/HybF involved in hydrogenase expression